MYLENHLENIILQADCWNNQYVVHFKGPNGLEFLEIFKDDYDLGRGKSFWNNFDPPYRTARVYDVGYWLTHGY